MFDILKYTYIGSKSLYDFLLLGAGTLSCLCFEKSVFLCHLPYLVGFQTMLIMHCTAVFVQIFLLKTWLNQSNVATKTFLHYVVVIALAWCAVATLFNLSLNVLCLSTIRVVQLYPSKKGLFLHSIALWIIWNKVINSNRNSGKIL